MSEKLKSIAVYCGHQLGTNPSFARAAVSVGEFLGKNNIRMVFGGGNVGLMGTVATAAIEAGGHVIGVSTNNVIEKQEPVHSGRFTILNQVFSGQTAMQKRRQKTSYYSGL